MKPRRLPLILLLAAWIVCAFIATMTVRSVYHIDSLVWASPVVAKSASSSGSGWYAFSAHGDLQCGSEAWVATTFGGTPPFSISAQSAPGISFATQRRNGWSLIGDGFWTDSFTDHQPSYIFQTSFIRIGWWLLLLAALLPTLPLTFLILRRHAKHRRLAQQGHCPNCGYDLRATRDRCPECGTVPATIPTSPT